MTRPVYVQYVVPLSIGMIVLGTVMLAVGIFDLTGVEVLEVGGWNYYLVGVGAVLLLAGVLLLWAYVKRVRHFKELMKEKSKKAFVSNLDDLEYTAWRLPKKFEEQVAEKKRGFEIKSK